MYLSKEDKGSFIDACFHYWNKDCSMTYIKMARRIGQDSLDVLIDEGMIEKKDNRREEFDREKILRGIQKACEKRAISVDQIEEIVAGIERDLREGCDREVSSKMVGEKIITALKCVDDVAYVRFASVYREFKDVADFIQELKSLLPEGCQSVELDQRVLDGVPDKIDD